MTASTITIDMSLDDTKEHEIAGHNYQSDDPCHCCHQSGENCTTDSCAEGEEKGDECKTTSNRVEDHNPREGFGGVC